MIGFSNSFFGVFSIKRSHLFTIGNNSLAFFGVLFGSLFLPYRITNLVGYRMYGSVLPFAWSFTKLFLKFFTFFFLPFYFGDFLPEIFVY